MLEAVMHRRMDYKIKCYKCVDFKKNVGHETKWCRKNICKKCGQSGHTKMDCMVDFENFPMPNEILYMIFRHLNQEDKNQWAMVCKRFSKFYTKANTAASNGNRATAIQHCCIPGCVWCGGANYGGTEFG